MAHWWQISKRESPSTATLVTNTLLAPTATKMASTHRDTEEGRLLQKIAMHEVFTEAGCRAHFGKGRAIVTFVISWPALHRIDSYS